MSASISFQGQVAIVTGAGGGMGLAYGRELARRGAAVLVNDSGGDMFGRGADASHAEAAAAGIRASGGTALADATPVGTGDAARAIARAALDAFGRIDILINNAGISASGAISAASDERVENAFRTNLLGPYHLVRAVWPTMQAQRHGRILNISSNAALGIGGSAAYASSKAGLLGLTFDTAQEGAASGILVNALMPSAYSRMIEAVPDPTFVAWMREQLPPEMVAAAAVYLVSRRSTVTGQVFSVGGGRMARVAWCEAPGIVEPEMTAERAAARIDEAADMGAAGLVESQQQEIGIYMRAFPMADGRRVSSLPASVFANRKIGS